MASILCIILTLHVSGCASNYQQGNGTVIAVKKMYDKDYKPHQISETGTQIGGIAGAAGGASIGGILGLMAGVLGASSGLGSGMLVLSTIVGAGVGGVIGGVAGCAVGGTVGYLADTVIPSSGMYQFEVKRNNDSSLYPDPKILTIIQYSKEIPVNTKVRIFDKNGSLFIRK